MFPSSLSISSIFIDLTTVNISWVRVGTEGQIHSRDAIAWFWAVSGCMLLGKSVFDILWASPHFLPPHEYEENILFWYLDN